MKKKLSSIGIITLVNLVLSNIVVLVVSGFPITLQEYLKYEIFVFVYLMLFANVFFSNKFCSGKAQEWLFFLSVSLLISSFLAFIFYSLIISGWKMDRIAWVECLQSVIGVDFLFYGLSLGFFIAVVSLYCGVFDRNILRFARTTGLIGKGNLNSIEANLENSRWMTKEEKEKNFRTYQFTKLGEVAKDGVPVMASLNKKGTDETVSFNSPCHSIIIGATGSGKTTTFVSPMIQILASTKAGSSMVMTDPKGELFSLHSGYLAERGYDVKVIDLRDTYSSFRWNPLDAIWDNYQKYAEAHNNAYIHRDALPEDMPLGSPKDAFAGKDEWYEFEGKAYAEYDELVTAIKVFKRKTYDEVYEDLNDLVSVLVPIENDRDPMWEKGARSIVLATMLAMLEDSEDKSLGMTKEKYNFFNVTKILQNSSNDYLQLRRYFAGRDPLSKAYSLSKQVCDAAESTRASYMSIVYEKLTLFNDAGICALTSSSDFSPESLANAPTALFLKIPDEKTTRHNLAGIFIMNLYKQLIKVATARPELSLPRNVYYILDEFGNMPKIENFDKMITVGRSRKIWFNMIVQSYSQLNNVYGDKVADIIKGNCGIKMFIGSNDMTTCKEFSELCGNVTVVTRSTSGTDLDKAVNVSTQTQVRPLIYPSELQRLNHGSDIGHSIIVTFGNYPVKTYFTPSFKVPLYKTGAMNTDFLQERYFDENEVYYDVEERNRKILEDEKGEERADNADADANGGVTEEKSEPAEITETAEQIADENAESVDFTAFEPTGESLDSALAELLDEGEGLLPETSAEAVEPMAESPETAKDNAEPNDDTDGKNAMSNGLIERILKFKSEHPELTDDEIFAKLEGNA